MEKYLWQYVDKIDGKLEEASEKFMKQVDKYIVGEMPEKFELEDEPEEKPGESPAKLSEEYHAIGESNDDDLMQRL